MVEINWIHEAEIWLRDIHTYIAIDNPAAAQRTIAGILARTQLLRTNPRLGYRYHAETAREIRILLYGHYRIAYLIQSENDMTSSASFMDPSASSATWFKFNDLCWFDGNRVMFDEHDSF